MKIGVCVKLVPPADTRIELEGAGEESSISDAVYKKLGLNTYDDAALAEAVEQKQKIGAEKIIIFSIDHRPKVDGELRNALAKGGDELVLISDPALAKVDSFTIAKVLAEAIKQEEVDVLFCGKLSTDGENSQVPAMISEFLGWSSATGVQKIEFDGTKFKAWRDIGNGKQGVVEGNIPTVLSCNKEINEPKLVKLKEKMAAKKKPLKTVSLADLGIENPNPLITECAWSLPEVRTECTFLEGSNEQMVQELIHRLRTEVKVL